MSFIPVIDISGWERGDAATRARIAAAVDVACRTVGFLQITGHGVPDDVIADMLAGVDELCS